MAKNSVDLTPEGQDAEGWMIFRTSDGDLIRVKANQSGGIDIRYPKDKYILKTLYNVESTGDVVLDLARREPWQT